ncbi:MAG: anthranilate phosphoribosyltransferase [Clostridiaceae bacterium]|jgi:anthranilate phosphoribosyltransferase|nr:anthranilate phosphoribosyltransferase [Clostridiaceae bacterium]
MIKNAINDVINGKNLDFDYAKAIMSAIMDGTATQVQIGALLTGLRMKGETVEEITACAAVMREKANKVNPARDVVDIVGTGGDCTNTFNISTTSAFVTAAGGVPVAKHGNRGISSKSGAADVLECLGINLNLTPEQNERILKECDICFMFAPLYHTSMKYAAPVRKELGIRTIFNILGPLANPAGASMQLMGVYDRKLIEPLAQVLSNLGVARGMVVSGGSEGMDEVTLTGETYVCEIRNGKLYSYVITPEQFGFKRCRLENLCGGSPEKNAQITMSILKGEEHGSKRDVVILNSAMAIYLGLDNRTVPDCVEMARDIIDSGKALKKLEEFRRLTNEVVL